VHTNLRRDRYAIADDTLEYARASLAAAEIADDPSQLALARFFVAFPLMFRGREDEAEPYFLAAIASSERVGDTLLLARTLAYYTILHRRLGRVTEVQATAERAGRIAESGNMHDYVGASCANQCWVAWHEGREADVERHAEAAFAAWSKLPPAYPYPFQWYLRLPLGAHLAQSGRFAAALEHWGFLLAKGQQALPEPLGRAIKAACELRERDPDADLATHARGVVDLARELRFL
jgi:tetratricopeptide (TPR) repeat protein